ncbi:hypothetical protein BS78_05G108100 [Paspalum vaginatum]|nr:hypothetical protein BS78_05G108100 [Paspalum vaginatum]
MKRLTSELDAVRHVLAKVELFSSGVPTGAKDGGRLTAAEAVAEDGGGRAAKKRKLASWEDSISKRVTPDDRDRLALRLAALAARLPDRAVAFLQEDQRGVIGDGADPHGDGGEVEMDLDTNVQSVKDDGSLVQLKMLLDRFVPLRSTPPKCHGHGRTPLLAASSVSCQSQHEEAGDKNKMAREEEEGVDICGGVSHMTIRDIADELVADIGVPRLLSPLPRKYVDLAEQGEYYVDICGDASPVVLLPAKPGDGNSSLGLSSSSGSDASSTDSDSSSGDSQMGPANEPPPEPAPEPLQVAEPVAEVQAMSTPTTPTVLLVSTSKPHVPAVLPQENDICAPAPPAPVAPETVQLPSPTPLADLIAMAQEAAEQRRQEEKERVEVEEECARVKARRELLEVERAALHDERIHPLDMELLGIAAFEHVVSTVRLARTRMEQPQPQVNVAVGPRISPGHPSILQQLGVFLKADDGGEEKEEQQQPPPLGFVASDGEHVEIEDGEII